MSKQNELRPTLLFILLLAAFGWLAGFDLLAASLLAAVLHEAGHLSVLWLFGAREGRILVHASGLEWRSDGRRMLSYGRELLCVWAGPSVNILFAAVFGRIAQAEESGYGYILAGAQLMMGLFNLLPILPLDGGRAMELLLSWWIDPFFSWRVMRLLSLLFSALLLAFSLYVSLSGGNGFLLLSAVLLLLLSLRELGLVKCRRSG